MDGQGAVMMDVIQHPSRHVVAAIAIGSKDAFWQQYTFRTGKKVLLVDNSNCASQKNMMVLCNMDDGRIVARNEPGMDGVQCWTLMEQIENMMDFGLQEAVGLGASPRRSASTVLPDLQPNSRAIGQKE